jgi:rSAM/selenodomain-associated transferase 1
VSAAIIVFAKAPVPGAVKTRLIPALGEGGAARFAERLVRQAIDTAQAAFPGAVELCCAPDATHPFFRGIEGVTLAEQGAGDLGARMHRALERSLRGVEAAVLIGADCPVLTPDDLLAAAARLAEGADAVLGPADDGGYVLIGARRVVPELFDGIAWGGARVLDEQRDRLRSLGWRWSELPRLWDVDRPEDLERVRHAVAGGARLLAGLA